MSVSPYASAWGVSLRRVLVASLVALACSCLGLGPVAQADPAGASAAEVAAEVTVTVVLIAASQDDGEIDPKLASHVQLLRTLPFRSYRYLDEHTFKVRDGGEDSVSLREGRRLSVKLISHDAKEAKLHLRLSRDDYAIMDTKVTVHRDRWFSLGVRKKNNQHLVVPVHVSY